MDDFGSDLAGEPVLDAEDGGLADGASAGVELLVGVFIGLLAADVGLIGFGWAGEAVGGRVPSLSNTVGHVPSRLLCNTQVPVQLHGADALEVS